METALPHPAELHIVSNHLKQHRMALVHLGVFEEMWDSCLFNMVRPPSRRNAGTRLRQPKPIATLQVASLFHYRTSILRGLAAHSLGEAIERLGKRFVPFDCGSECKVQHSWSTEAAWFLGKFLGTRNLGSYIK